MPSRLLLILSFVAFVSLGLPDGLLGVAWPSMRRSFDLPLDALGVLFITMTAGYITASFMSGVLLRHFSLGALLALSCFMTACALIGYSLAPRWELIVVLGVLLGFGGGAIDTALNTFAAHNFSPRTVNLLHAFYGLGTTMGPVLMTSILVASLPWQRGYLIVGLAQVALALCFVATRRRWPRDGDQAGSKVTRASLGETLKLPATLVSVAVFILYCGLEASTGAWLFTLLSEGRGVATATAGAAVSVFWGSLMAARIVFGIVQVRGALSRWLIACMTAILLATLALTVSTNPIVSIAAASLIGFACGPIFPWLIAGTPQRLGAAHGANAIGVQIASAALGLSLAPTLTGVLADHYGVELIPKVLIVLAGLLLSMYWVLERVSNKAGERRKAAPSPRRS